MGVTGFDSNVVGSKENEFQKLNGNIYQLGGVQLRAVA